MKLNRIVFLFLMMFVALRTKAQPELQASSKEMQEMLKSIRESSFNDSIYVSILVGNALKKSKEKASLRDEVLIHLYHGNFYFQNTKYERAQEKYKLALDLARKTKDETIINLAHIRYVFSSAEKDIFSAEKETKKLLKEAEIKGFIVNKIEAYNGLGYMFEKRQIKDEALSYYLQGLKLAEQENLPYYKAIILNNIGIIKLNNEQIVEAEKDFNNALKFALEKNDYRSELSIRNNLGSFYLRVGKFDEAMKQYKAGLQIAKKKGHAVGQGFAYGNICNNYHYLQEIDLANTYIDSAITIFEKEKEIDFLGMSYLVKANLALEKKQYYHAQQAIDKIFELLKQKKNIETLIQAHLISSIIQEEKGNLNEAMEHLKRHHHLKDSITNSTNWGKLAELQALYGKEKLEFELDKTKSQNTILQKDNELKKSRLRLIIGSSISLVLIILAGFYIRYVRIKKKNQALFSIRLIEKVDEERGRISRDLHDDIGQSLSLLRSKIDLFEKQKIDNLETIKTDLSQVIDFTRNISHNLHPVFITKIGLYRSLVSLINSVEKNTGIICSLDADESINEIAMEKQTQLYRILQECINNTLKHAQASALKITFHQSNHSIEMNYRDNGKKPVQHENKEGIGLMTIRERANIMSAKLLYEFSNKGFVLTLKFSKS